MDVIGIISVGIEDDGNNTTNWYRAHAVNRRKDGAMIVYALDKQRTAVTIPARNFKGVVSGMRTGIGSEINPCILTYSSNSSK
jgi:hypothetical protein